MKNILSFFICFLLLGAQVCFAETDVSVQSGVVFSSKYLQANLYGEFETSTGGEPEVTLNSWALRVQPFEFLSITGGTLVYGGIWSRFNNSHPLSISALKQPYTLATRLITSLPSKDTTTAQPALALGIDFSFLKINTFIGGFQKNQLWGGVGISLPFSLKPHSQLLPAGLRGTWTMAWRVARLGQKDYDTWFIPQPFFTLDYYHAFIQDLSLKTKYNTLLFAAGFSQSPYGKPSGFIRTEYSLALPVFVLNAQFFMSDLDYLGQNGNFERDTIQMALNPQLRFNFFGTAIRSIRFGITAETTYKNTTDSIPKSDWYTTFKAGADIQFVMLSFGLSAAISDLLLVKYQKKPLLLLEKESLLKIQSKLLFRPWYVRAFTRTWTLNTSYEKYLKKPDSQQNLNIKGIFSGSFIIADEQRFDVGGATELRFKIQEKIKLNATNFLIKASTDLRANFLEATQVLQLRAQTEFDVKEGKVDGIKAEFSVVLRL